MSLFKTLSHSGNSQAIASEWIENVLLAEDSGLKSELSGYEELVSKLEGATKLNQDSLIGKLNYIHFIGGEIILLLKHTRFEDTTFVLKASPEPCFDGELVCHTADNNTSAVDLSNYEISNLLIDEGRTVVLIPVISAVIQAEGFKIALPEKAYAVNRRKVKRYACQGIEAELVQSGRLRRGALVEFSPASLKIEFQSALCSFKPFNPDGLILVHLRKHHQVLFSGLCHFIRQISEDDRYEIVLAPLANKNPRFRKRKIRNPRQKLVPSPTIVFNHPFFGSQCRFEISDISTSGFRVYETKTERTLMPGMIIPELVIDFGGTLKVKCEAQVIYSMREDEKGFRSGLAILDMELSDYTQMTSILTKSMDNHFYVSSSVDTDGLWEFFFESGFIYPGKYKNMYIRRENFKNTYKKICERKPEIATHFTYQKNGKIFGYIGLVQAYERSWLIQHHSSRAIENKRAGFLVLKEIMHYLNDIYRLPSAKMDYAMTYFRPENRIPARIFGGFEKELDNAHGCSIDLFSYMRYKSGSIRLIGLPEGWSLEKSSNTDLLELEKFYYSCVGGLLINALGLKSKNKERESLEEIYANVGLVRKLKTYSLSYLGSLKAILFAEKSDSGLNLSELLNGLKVFIVRPEGLTWDILSMAISKLSTMYNNDTISILFQPSEFVKNIGVPCDKEYKLWILNVEYANQFMQYMREKFRIGY